MLSKLKESLCCDYSFKELVKRNDNSTLVYLPDKSLMPSLPKKFKGLIFVYEEETESLDLYLPYCGKLQREFELILSLKNYDKELSENINEEQVKDLIELTIKALKDKPISDFYQMTFRLPTYMSQYFTAVPFKLELANRNGFKFDTDMRVIPLDIIVQNKDSPYAKTLFRPVECGEGGMFAYEFIGKSPLSGRLVGSIELLIKAPAHYTTWGNKDLYADREMDLVLHSQNVPDYAKQRNKDFRQYRLSRSSRVGSIRDFVVYDEFICPTMPTDFIIPARPNMIEALKNSSISDEHNFYKSSVLGRIDKDNEELIDVDKGFLTTEWMNFTNPSERRGIIYLYFEGKGIKPTIQYKRKSDGKIIQGKTPPMETSLGFYRIPYGINSMRITYAMEGDVVPESVRFYNYNEDTARIFDPVRGSFIKVRFDVSTPIEFYPNAIYRLGLLNRGDAIEDPKHGFSINGATYRILNSSLSADMFGKPEEEDFNNLLYGRD